MKSRYLVMIGAVVFISACMEEKSNVDIKMAANSAATDGSAPVLRSDTPLSFYSPYKTAAPTYSFSSTERGTVSYAGGCSSNLEYAVRGKNTLVFDVLENGKHNDCTITVTDEVGNAQVLRLGRFAVEADDSLMRKWDQLWRGQQDASAVEQLDISFTKLDTKGNALSADAISWACVKDNTSGYVWEVKSHDGGLHDKDHSYTWYNSSVNDNGGEHGVGDSGVATSTGLQHTDEVSAGSDNCFDQSRCDTEKYAADVNQSTYCGFDDWYLPSKQELETIHFQSEKVFGLEPEIISLDYFPNSQIENYWTATSHGPADTNWPVDPLNYRVYGALKVNFAFGFSTWTLKSQALPVRLMRKDK